jgi:hypothetical protein
LKHDVLHVRTRCLAGARDPDRCLEGGIERDGMSRAPGIECGYCSLRAASGEGRPLREFGACANRATTTLSDCSRNRKGMCRAAGLESCGASFRDRMVLIA